MASEADGEIFEGNFDIIIDRDSVGLRLDKYLAHHEMLQLSRTMIQQFIRSGEILVNGEMCKAGYRLCIDDELSVTVPPPLPSLLIPEKVDFQIIHEDEDVVVLSKPPGIVVHPSVGHGAGTLVHGLLYHCQNLSGINGESRPGIVHRLDRDTSGVMVVAKNDFSHHSLVDQFKDRTVEKIYHAIIDGRLPKASGRIVSRLGRHPVNRKKMAIVTKGGREAITRWQVLEELPSAYTFVELYLETGRTHQIRVQMASMGLPIAGDEMYGRKNKKYQELGIVRQCLHASALTFDHPRTGMRRQYRAGLWPDMVSALEALRRLE